MFLLFLDIGCVAANVSNHENGQLQPPDDLLESRIKHTFLISPWQQTWQRYNHVNGVPLGLNILNRFIYRSWLREMLIVMLRKWHNLWKSS